MSRAHETIYPRDTTHLDVVGFRVILKDENPAQTFIERLLGKSLMRQIAAALWVAVLLRDVEDHSLAESLTDLAPE